MCYVVLVLCSYMKVWFVFFFKQKTAYEMRISDWSSDVCSSDLQSPVPVPKAPSNPLAWLPNSRSCEFICNDCRADNATEIVPVERTPCASIPQITTPPPTSLRLVKRTNPCCAVWLALGTSHRYCSDRKSTRLNSSH